MLRLYEKSFNNVVTIISDNYATNRTLAQIMDVGFVECALHRFNLALKDVVEKHKVLAEKKWMRVHKLCFPICRVKLRKKTDLPTVKYVPTIWSSIRDMQKGYDLIHDFISNLLSCGH